MREIKFRAWDKSKNIMLYDEFRIGHDGTPYTYRGKLGSYDWESDEDLILMQSTGLKDKNGKEIYEGDVVIDEEIGYCEIKWDDGHDGWRYASRGICHGYIDTAMCEVIGNIYENPSLLKEEKR